MAHGGSWRIAAAAAWAVVGLLGGHVFTYLLLFPDAAVHDAELAASGHAWMELAGPAMVMALATFVVAVFLAAHRTTSRRFRFAVLAAVQVTAFAGIELGERLAVGMPLDLLPHELADHGLAAILLLGTVVQVLAAWLGSAATRLVERMAAGHRRRVAYTRRAGPHRLAFTVLLHAFDTHASARPIRGPPSLAIEASAS